MKELWHQSRLELGIKELWHQSRLGLGMKDLNRRSRHGTRVEDLCQDLPVCMGGRGIERSVYEEMFFDSLV